MKIVLIILLVILFLPISFMILMTGLAWMYMDYLHNKPNPTKEEWKVKL